MQPWTLIDSARVAGGTADLRLLRRGEEFVINIGPALLMGSRMRDSEKALATLGCASLRERGGAGRVLIGGLGMGFTLRAALDMLGPDAAVEVAEVVPAVADWARGPLAHLTGGAASDPRVRIHLTDVARPIRAARGSYDAILLDVDNGPASLTRDGNDALYGAAGLRSAWTALAGGGVLAVWSAFPDRGFSRRLDDAGFATREHGVRAQGGRGARHTVWVATRPGRRTVAGPIAEPGHGPRAVNR